MGESKAVRLRRATLEDFDFIKEMTDDIDREVLYSNYQAFLEIPGIKELIEEDKKKEDVVIEFDYPEFTLEWFEKELTKFKYKYYIIELIDSKNQKVKDIGCFKVAYFGKKEPNRINSWCLYPEYFELKGEVLKMLLAQKELTNKQITIVSLEDWLKSWLENFGFKQKNCYLCVMSE